MNVEHRVTAGRANALPDGFDLLDVFAAVSRGAARSARAGARWTLQDCQRS
jgi:hypothetical protein